MTDLARRLMTGAAAPALMLALAGTAHAQTDPVTPSAPQDQPGQPTSNAGRDNAGISPGDIVVTATKREQRVQDVPISMEVITGERINELHSNDFKAIMNYVPNVFVESTAGDDVIYIRGFGSPPANFSFDQSVSLYLDGVYAGRNRQAQTPFFDVARVEVLRGPQGALFGKNTPAGAVSVVSAGPTDHFEAEVTGLYNFDFRGFDINWFASGPVSDTFGIRVAGRVEDQHGYIRNLATGKKDPRDRLQLVRVTARWEPSTAFDITGKLEYSHTRRTGGITVSSPLTSGQDPQRVRYLEDAALGREGTENTSLLTSATANLKLGEFTVTSVTGYSTFDSNIVNGFDQRTPTGQIVPNSVYNSYPEKFYQVSQELRLLSPAHRPLEFIVGGYYDSSHYHLDQLGGFNIASLNYFGLLHTLYRQQARSYSIFGQATLNVIDRLRVIGSLRYTHTHKDANFYGRLEYGPFALRPVNTVAVGTLNEGLVDPSGTVQFDVTNQIMVYATYGRGSKSGGFVSNTYGTTSATFGFRPERSRNYEAGIKSTLFHGRAIANVSVYNTQFRDLQVSVYNPTTSTYLTGNAASATSKGVEGTLALFPVHNFDISASAAYQDIKYDNYPGAACLATQSVAQCNPASPASIAANNLAGYRPAYTSRFTANAQAHFRIETGTLKFDMTGIVSGRSSYYDSDNQSPIFGLQRGYAKFDARIQVAPQDDRWHLALIGKNLTNRRTTGSSFNLPAPITAVPRAILYLEPLRNIAVEAGFRF